VSTTKVQQTISGSASQGATKETVPKLRGRQESEKKPTKKPYIIDQPQKMRVRNGSNAKSLNRLKRATQMVEGKRMPNTVHKEGNNSGSGRGSRIDTLAGKIQGHKRAALLDTGGHKV